MASQLKTRIHPKAQSPAASATSTSANSEDERRRLIAEAAYFRALERGFAGGDPVQDWLEAEREVMQRLPREPRPQRSLLAVA